MYFMQIIELNLSDKTAAILDKISLENNKIKEDIVSQLIEEYAQDLTDYKNAIEVLNSNEKTYSLNEIKKEYGLDD